MNADEYDLSGLTDAEQRLWANRRRQGLAPTPEMIRRLDDVTSARRGAIPPAPASHVSRLKTAADRANRPEPRWLVERVLPDHGVGQLVGPSYTGKTYVALDLALRVANGLGSWCGGEIAEAGDVVYVLMEGAFGFADRERAWLSAHPGTTNGRLFTIEEESVDLASRASVATLLADVRNHEGGVRPRLVVVDTQALATPGTDEQSNTDMNLVFSRCKAVAVELDAVVLLVHHSGHKEAERARGASAQFAACDFSVSIAKDATSPVGTLHVRKVKDYTAHGPYGFELVASGASAYARELGGVAAAAKSGAALKSDVWTFVVERGPVGLAEVRRAMRKRELTVRHLLDELVAEGALAVEMSPSGRLEWRECATP